VTPEDFAREMRFMTDELRRTREQLERLNASFEKMTAAMPKEQDPSQKLVEAGLAFLAKGSKRKR